MTGVARGIGWAAVSALVMTGVTPGLFDRDAQALAVAHQTLSDEGVAHLTERVDITDEQAVDAAFEKVAARYGRLDTLVNNAGIALRRPTVEMSTVD